MKKLTGILPVVLLLGLVVVGPAHALNLSLFNAGTAGVQASDFSWSYGFDAQVGMNVIDIYETWTSNELTLIEFTGFPRTVNVYIRKHVYNDTGIDWASFNHELLDPAGQAEDFFDPKPYPTFVPSGFTTSNDIDGLSFAQASDVARTSQKYADLLVDEVTDKRDFLEFYDGLVSAFGADADRRDVMSFGIRDNGTNVNQPFLLAQRTNVAFNPPVIPEPATLLLLGGGLLGGGLAARRRRRAG